MANFNKIIEQYRAIARSKTDVGDRFEHLIKRFLLSYQFYDNDKVDKVWLWNEWPYKSQLGGHDTGIDLIALTTESDYWAIQCKCQAAETTIDKVAVDSFLATSGKTWTDDQQMQRTFQLCVFVSTTNKWSVNAESAFKNRTTAFFKMNLAYLETAQVDWALLSEGVMGSKALTKPHQLRDHQQTALTAVHEYFKTNDRGKLIMACGTGKTFTALRIAEHETGSSGFVLCLVPSIALLRQVFLEWHRHKKAMINFVWICSDPTASRINELDEVLAYDISELPWKATTNINQVRNNLTTCLSKPGMTVVFSTYQSIDVVHELQTNYQIKCFDLIICDEAHRTTGVTLHNQKDESNFKKVHQATFIQGTKRLYMTATPLIYHDTLKKKLEQNLHTYASMDDTNNYGNEIYKLSFGDAVKKDLLTEYRLFILTIDKKHLDQETINYFLQHKSLLESKDKNFDQNLMKLLGCVNALKKVIVDNDEAKTDIGSEPMQRVVAFCGSINDSKAITRLFNKIGSYEQLHHPGKYYISAEHMDGTMSTVERDDLLSRLEKDLNPLEGRILTNVRCLNEGIDVPALDAVLFLSARSSQIDIVQSIGRVMRKSPGKKFGYIIIPVISNDKITSGDDIFSKNYPEYQIVWNVMNALAAHDELFGDEISKLTYTFGKYTKNQKAMVGQVHGDGVKINEFDEQGEMNVQIKHFRQLIKAKTVTIEQGFLLRWVKEIKQVYESQKHQINDALRKDDNFRRTFNRYHERFNLSHNEISTEEFIDNIAQYEVMHPIFNALFKNQFAHDNDVNIYFKTVLKQLATAATNDADQKKLNKFYESVKSKTDNIDTAGGKQALIMNIYNKFFTMVFPKEVAKLGIVYTPIPIVDFIVKSVADLLPIHFQNTTINDHGVYIIDPFAGTGSFIVRLLENNLIDPANILHKYSNEIYANEITLLAYYVASINIINSFYYLKVPSVKGSFTNFWGMRFLDTFQTTEANYHDWDHFHKTYYKNNVSMDLKRPPITIIIGNPPYSKCQSSFNDQNQNTVYPNLNKRIAKTYVAQSSSYLVNSLYDSYYKAFRWSTDRLHIGGVGL